MVPNKIPNHDPIDQIRWCILETKTYFHGIHKVASHQNPALLNLDEIWVCQGNDAADSVAGHVHAQYPQLLDVQQQLKREIQELCNMRFWAHKILVNTGQLAIDILREMRRNDDEESTPIVSFQRQIMDYQSWTFPMELPEHLYKYNIPEWSTVAGWIQSLHTGTERMFLSCADFHLQWPNLGPWYKISSKRWFGGDARPHHDLAKGPEECQIFWQDLVDSWEHRSPRDFNDRKLMWCVSGLIVSL